MNRSAAFSLLELLAVVAILGIVITLTAMLLVGGRRAGDNMLREEDVMRAGRLAIDNLTDDLRHAVADSSLPFVVVADRDGVRSYGMECSEINLAAWSSDGPESGRSTRAVQYWVEQVGNPSNSFRLMRGCRAVPAQPSSDWYDNRPSDRAETGVVAANVAAFRVAVSDTEGGMARSYSSNRLPAYVDIYLELLDEGAANRAAVSDNQSDFVDRNAVRFATRVALDNRYAEDTR
jgi:prepilin-type N-terminal cleavage/methylation domain-containing protein